MTIKGGFYARFVRRKLVVLRHTQTLVEVLSSCASSRCFVIVSARLPSTFLVGPSPRRTTSAMMLSLSCKARRTYFLKHSCRLTMFSCLSWRSIFTSRIVVFFTISSSSDSLNFLIATVYHKDKHMFQLFRSKTI